VADDEVVPTFCPLNETLIGEAFSTGAAADETAMPETSPAVSTKRIRGSRRFIFSGS
jgi:hypothetical protein